MRTDGVADVGMLLVFLCQLHTHDGMWFLQFFRPDLSNVVEKPGAFRLLHVQAQFRRHDGAEVGDFS